MEKNVDGGKSRKVNQSHRKLDFWVLNSFVHFQLCVDK